MPTTKSAVAMTSVRMMQMNSMSEREQAGSHRPSGAAYSSQRRRLKPMPFILALPAFARHPSGPDFRKSGGPPPVEGFFARRPLEKCAPKAEHGSPEQSAERAGPLEGENNHGFCPGSALSAAIRAGRAFR